MASNWDQLCRGINSIDTPHEQWQSFARLPVFESQGCSNEELERNHGQQIRTQHFSISYDIDTCLPLVDCIHVHNHTASFRSNK